MSVVCLKFLAQLNQVEWKGHVTTHMREIIDINKNLIGKPQGKKRSCRTKLCMG